MLPKSKKHKNCLWQHFRLTAFKPLQWQIISNIIEPRGERNDVCAVIATGYGKSLSYQYPAFYLNKVVLVISPLIALMEDQVAALNERSQPNDCACLLGTAQEDRGIKQRILRRQYKLVYATPEYITRGNGLKLLHDLGQNLALIAIDEAHCISKWGHEFRPAYRQLQQLRAAVPHVRLLALTGTATRRVRLDICQQLQLHKPLLLCCPIDRANLELTVRPKSDDLWSDLQQYLSWATEAAGAVIIYNNTIKETQLMAKRLTQLGRPCHSYHSKLPLEQKRRHQQEFSEDRVRCMAATTAFGMGIDKPNVRLVVHYGAPSDMERYYQEIGRAGRDGLPAKCVLFYGDTDAALHQRLQQSQALTAERSEELQQLARSMQSYIESSECRRQFILKYFDDATSLSNWQWRGNCCDNCRKARQLRGHTEHPLPTQFDVGREARLLLGMLRDVNGRVGYGKLILALRGSRNKCVNSACREHEHFGQGAHRSITWYKALAEHLKAMGYIKDEYQKSGTSAYGYLMPQVTLKGCCWLDNDKTEGTLLIEPSPRLAKLLFKRKKKSKSSKSPRKSKDEDKDLKLDWGSDIDLSELDEKVEQQLEEQQRAAVTDNVWGPDIDIDFQQIDAAVAQQQMTKLNDQHQDQDLASLLADCQKILHEEQEHATRTLKARKRVWEYLEGSYQKMPLIPKYKYSSQPRKAN